MKKFINKQEEDTMSILGYEQAAGSKKWKVIPVLTIEEVTAKTKPQENGVRDGNENKPGAKDTEMSRTEKNILFEGETFLNKTKDFINKNLTDISRKVEAFLGNGMTNIFSDLKLEPKKEFNKYKVQAEPDLISLRVAERAALRDLKRFKSDNNLQCNAVYPESTVKHLGFVFVFLFGECFANTYFFSANSDLGLLGGFFQALAVSTANVGISYLFGWMALTQMNHIRPVRKNIGRLSLAIYLSTMTIFHLLVAHYRDLLTIDPDRAIFLVWSRFRENPFGLDTFESMLVLGIGVGVSILAAAKGYKHDDKYPGFGDVDREYKRHLQAYNLRESEVRRTLVGLVSKAEETVYKRLAEYEGNFSAMKDLLNGAKSVVAHIDNIDSQVSEVVGNAVTIYREANKTIRTEAVPAYFSDTPVLKNRLNKGIDILTIERLEQQVAVFGETLDRIRENAAKAIEELFAESEQIGENIDNLAAKVDQTAKGRVEELQNERGI